MGASYRNHQKSESATGTPLLPPGYHQVWLDQNCPDEPRSRRTLTGAAWLKGNHTIFLSFLPDHLAEQAEEALKSSYNLEFLGIGREIKERELEDKLIEQLKDFILELGYGFCFTGRQHRVVAGSKEYFIDLLEAKVREFNPRYTETKRDLHGRFGHFRDNPNDRLF